MIERIEVAGRVVMVVAYVAVCAGFLLMIFPGARLRVVQLARTQAYRYRVGVHRARSTPLPEMVRHLARTDLPDEPAA